MEHHLTEGTIVLKTIQTLDKLNIPLNNFWLSSDAVRGSLKALNIQTESDPDYALYSTIKEKQILTDKTLEKFKGSYNFKLQNSIPDILGTQHKSFREIFAVECKLRRDSRIYKQLLHVRPHVHYTWAALPANLYDSYEYFFKELKIGYLLFSGDGVSDINNFSLPTVCYPAAQGYFDKIKYTQSVLSELEGLERLQWSDTYISSHALSGSLRMNELIKFLNQIRQKLYWKTEEFNSLKIVNNARMALQRLHFIFPTQDYLSLTDGTLRILYFLNKLLPDLGDELSKDSLKRIRQSSSFKKYVIPEIRNHFLSLPSVKSFLQIILEVQQHKQSEDVSMVDIFSYLIQTEKYLTLKWLFVGNTPTTAITTINNSADICFKCIEPYSCNEFLKTKSDKKETLLFYRKNYSHQIISQIKGYNSNDKVFQNLIKDPLLIKFLVPYSLVVENKRFLIELGILKNTDILAKNSGDYCPFKDIWTVEPGIVQYVCL